MKVSKRIISAVVVIIALCFIMSMLFPEKLFQFSMEKQRSGAGLVQKEINIGDHKIVYLEGGSGGETIVLIHGFGASKDNWPGLVKLLPGYHFIIPDLPGFGDSTKLESAKYDVLSQAERLDKFFKLIGLKKFYIAGNSMGGNISGIYAARYPQKVQALILLDNSGVTSPAKSALALSLEKGVNPLLIKSKDDYKRFINFIFVKAPFIPYPFIGVLAEKSISSRSFNDKVFKDITGAPASLETHMASYDMPVLIIWGDKDQLLDVSSVTVMEKGIKNHTTRILKDCGHVPMMERPEETAGYIKSFIESVKQYLHQAESL